MIKYFRSDSFVSGLTDFKALSARMSDTFSKVSRCLKWSRKILAWRPKGKNNIAENSFALGHETHNRILFFVTSPCGRGKFCFDRESSWKNIAENSFLLAPDTHKNKPRTSWQPPVYRNLAKRADNLKSVWVGKPVKFFYSPFSYICKTEPVSVTHNYVESVTSSIVIAIIGVQISAEQL